MSQQQHLIKVINGITGDTRRVIVSNSDLNALHASLRTVFGNELPAHYNILSTTHNGGGSALTTDAEFYRLTQDSRGSTIKLLIEPISLPPVKVPVRNCSAGHPLKPAAPVFGGYQSGWVCDLCRYRGNTGELRWNCSACMFDVCFSCYPNTFTFPTPPVQPSQPCMTWNSPSSSSFSSPHSVQIPAWNPISPPPPPHHCTQPFFDFRQHQPQVQTTAPPAFDSSLPPALLEPIFTLESMGFTDRLHNIELLIDNGLDIEKTVSKLAAERKAAEEKAAEAQRKEAASKAQEEAKNQALLRRKRREAANIAVKTPEKLGSDIARLEGLGFNTILATTSILNAGGDFEAALNLLLESSNNQNPGSS